MVLLLLNGAYPFFNVNFIWLKIKGEQKVSATKFHQIRDKRTWIN
jgi:hypothetical protein